MGKNIYMLELQKISHQKPRRLGGNGIMFLRCQSEELSTQVVSPPKTSSRNEGKIKTISNEEKLREYVSRRHVLKEWLQDVLQTENKLFLNGISKYQKMNKSSEYTGKYNRISSLEFSKLYD